MLSKLAIPSSWSRWSTYINTIVTYLFIGLTLFVYFLNLDVNNIWTPNESFYAEAVREMLESGNFLDIMYNYQPRFNKPPLLYWLMALSSIVFGLSEFSIRLVIALCGLGTIYLVYQMGKLLKGRDLGLLAAAIMAFSFQFVINARYGSPAVPLTFFFTWTVYLFLKGYLKQKPRYYFFSYLALGLTILMKGYPYLIVISLIIGLFLFVESRYNFKAFWHKIKAIKPWYGLPVSFVIGMSWVFYMYLSYGTEFYEVFMDETFRRAFTRKSSFKPFYYLEVNLWGFLPYTLSFYLGFLVLAWKKFKGVFQEPVLKLGLSWFLVMLVVFTIAKGKIPTYFIQAYPGMSLLSAYFILSLFPRLNFSKWISPVQFLIPGALFVILGVVLVFIFQPNLWLFLLAILPLIGLYVGNKLSIPILKQAYFPYYSFLFTNLLFVILVLPRIETGFRNHHLLGKAIQEEVEDSTIPVYIESFLVHNLPYYAERKVVEYQSVDQIQSEFEKGRALALVPLDHIDYYPHDKEVWRGIIYEGSESRTLEFILETLKYSKGQTNRFREYVVLYKED